MIVRPMRQADLHQVAKIEENSFSDPWRYEDFEDSLNREDDTILLLVAVDDDDTAVCGYVTLYGAADEGEIMNIAVDETKRRAGVATGLMNGIKEIAADKGMELESIFLEVRKSNAPAIAFYEKCGYQQIGVRKGFYQNPPEDALLMKLEVAKA